MKGKKPQNGNQFGCHAGPFNMNSAPLISNKVPPKHPPHRSDRFFKPVEPRLPIEKIEYSQYLAVAASLPFLSVSGPKL